MKKIGGNIDAVLQKKTILKNEIGESIESYETYKTLHGYLDFMSGGTESINFNAKLEETTHVFVCDYTPIDLEENQCRLICKEKTYEVTMIDDPMELHYQLEIFLKYTGD